MKRLKIFGVLAFLIAQASFAQSEKSYQTKKISSQIKIDGDLDEKSWDNVKWEGNFIQNENGNKPAFDTQFKILYDTKNLYVAIRAFDKQPDSILVPKTMRDAFGGDWVEINIDSDFDRKDAYSFTITAAGIRGDEHIQTSENWFNGWNPSWTAKTKIDKKGWVAEMKIPLRELEVYDKKEKWSIQVNRRMARFNESSSWTSIPDEDKWVNYFGLLEGIENIAVSKKLSATSKVKSELLKQDFIDLHNSLKSSYPSLYRYHSKEYIDENYRQTLLILEREMTLIDFYKTISTYISIIGDGHMNVEFPNYFANSYYKKLKKLPFKLNVTSEGGLVTENYSQNNLLNGSRIVAINGKSVKKLIDEITDFIPSDGHNQTGKYYRMSDNFDFYCSLVSDFGENVKIIGHSVIFARLVVTIRRNEIGYFIN